MQPWRAAAQQMGSPVPTFRFWQEENHQDPEYEAPGGVKAEGALWGRSRLQQGKS